uniref:Uncharacterized protein n=1 Tax=Triticum urartu TaxID=4572 RepID=A0A8R7TZ27_TRIUA
GASRHTCSFFSISFQNNSSTTKQLSPFIHACTPKANGIRKLKFFWLTVVHAGTEPTCEATSPGRSWTCSSSCRGTSRGTGCTGSTSPTRGGRGKPGSWLAGTVVLRLPQAQRNHCARVESAGEPGAELGVLTTRKKRKKKNLVS